MKPRAHLAILAVISTSASCNYTDGPCWPVGQDGSGDPVIGSPGTGNNGDGTQDQPQSGTTYNCNATDPAPAKGSGSGKTEGTPTQGSGTGGAAPQGGSPCQNQCYWDYDVAVNACTKIVSDTAERKACQDTANAVLTHCMGACDGDPKEKCMQKCDKAMEKCFANCPKGDVTCMAQCNEVYSKCLKDC